MRFQTERRYGMQFGVNLAIYGAIVVGLVLVYLLGRRMRTLRNQRNLGARLERVQQRHGG